MCWVERHEGKQVLAALADGHPRWRWCNQTPEIEVHTFPSFTIKTKENTKLPRWKNPTVNNKTEPEEKNKLGSHGNHIPR